MPLAVGTGVVVIVVAAAVVLLAVIVAASMRGRRRGAAQRRDEARRDLDRARERAEQAEHERDLAQAAAPQGTDAPIEPDDATNPDSSTDSAPDRPGMWRRIWK